DEAHRSVAKDLGTYLMAAVPNATIIGFTGTPIAKTEQGEGTFKIFGKDDERGYLDKYSIAESIEDETTLLIKHVMAPSEMTVPAFDGAENGEEFQCAQAIDSLPGLKFLIRNVARHPISFWLPTATDKFYPDFVAQLDDGRLLVVEYKGAHIADGPDTAEKRIIGQLWERKSGGKGLFVVVEKTVDGRDMRDQIVGKL